MVSNLFCTLLFYISLLLIFPLQASRVTQNTNPVRQKSPAANSESQPKASNLAEAISNNASAEKSKTTSESTLTQGDQKQGGDHPKLTDWIQAILSAALLVVIIIQACIYNKQRKLMQLQWKAMRMGLTETRKSVRQNERAVEASEAQAVASKTSAEAANRMVEITQQAYIASERAYVGVREITIGNLSVGQIPTLYVTWYNGGKTPASRFRANPYLVFGDEPERRGDLIDDDWSDSRGNFLPTGISQTMPYPQAETGFKFVTNEMLAELQAGSKRLYAMIIARYKDFTGQVQYFETSYIYDQWEEKFVEL